MSNKRGRLSGEERDFIIANAAAMTPEQIALQISRTPEMVAEFIKLNVKPASVRTPDEAERVERVTIRQELRTSERWKRLKQELTGEEIKFFEEEYIRLMTQFGSGVLATEEAQVFDIIKLDLLKSRNLVERRKAREDISRLEKMQEEFLAQFGGDPSRMSDTQKEFSLNLETQLNQSRQAEQSRTNDYVKLQERYDKLMQAVKGTRDQRIKDIQSSNKDWLSVIKMLSQRDAQLHQGRQMELMRLAGEKAKTDLGRPTRYDDGSDDQPILSADTVDLGREEEGGEDDE